jgi:NAD(P)-dependent dehydrogenase (short-subunit alcohol dehydrogenase family)
VDLELTNKRAVVTGGSRGIGLAVAKALAAEGADVALLARDKAVERRIGASVGIGRLVTAEEVATVVAFLASPKSVALHGDAITASGGAVVPICY